MILNIDPYGTLGEAIRRQAFGDGGRLYVSFTALDGDGDDCETIGNGMLSRWTLHKGCDHVPARLETEWEEPSALALPAWPELAL